MKRFLLPAVAMCMSILSFATPHTSNEIPTDFTNDIWLNTDYKELQVGSTYKIIARRVPEATQSDVSNTIQLPEFTYEIIEGSSVTIDHATGIITANTTGRTLIEVGYKKMTAFGKDYPAISPVNKAYMVVNVVDSTIQHGIEITTDIKATSYDTYYFSNNGGYDLTFNVTATGATSTEVKCNGTKITPNTDGSYTARLVNRSNVLEVTASNATGSKHWAQVIDARRVEINIANITNPGMPIVEGDSIEVSFNGIVLPVYKLCKIYNPCMEFPSDNPEWSTKAVRINYKNNLLGSVENNINITQWDIATNNTIGLKMTKSGQYMFTDGVINEMWYGALLGTEKQWEGQPDKNVSEMETQKGTFSKLPAFRINVMPKYALADNEKADTLIAGRMIDVNGEPMTLGADSVWQHTYSEDPNHSMLMLDNIILSHLPSGNSWGGTTWEGFTVSAQQSDYSENSGMTHQFSTNARGGLLHKDSAYIVGFCSGYLESQGIHACEISFGYTEPCRPQGVYVALSNWPSQNIIYGDDFTRRFTTGDSLKLIVHGVNGDTESSIEYNFADYSDTNEANHYMQSDWQWVDLSTLGEVTSIYFTMKSTDSGQFGDNTAAYFNIDRLIVTAKKETVAPPTGLENVNDNSISIYPNPAYDVIYVSAEAAEATIYSIDGQLIATKHVVNGAINITDIAQGVYIIRINGKTERFIKL